MGSRNYDRFYSETPGVTEEEFRESKFLKYYKKTRRCPDHDAVIDSLLNLSRINSRFHPVCRMIEDEPSDYDVIKTYTAELHYGSKAFYRYVNQQIMNDRKI